MPKKVKVSISAIVKEVNKALKELEKGEALAVSAKEKSSIAARIKKLEKAEKELKASCPKGSHSMTIVIPGT
jgi:TusA-related sulfurtransferase